MVTFDLQNSKVKGQNPLVTSYAWNSIDMFAFLFVAIDHFWLRYRKFHIWLENSRLRSQPRSNLMATFEALEFNWYVCFFVSWQSDHFCLRYSKFYNWPRKFKVKVMAKLKLDSHIWALELNRYVCFLFRGNRTIFGWDIANSIFDLENSRSR